MTKKNELWIDYTFWCPALLAGVVIWKKVHFISSSMKLATCGEKWVEFPSGGSKEIDIKRESKHTQTIKWKLTFCTHRIIWSYTYMEKKKTD